MYKTKKEAMVIKKFKQKPAKNIEIEGDGKADELEIDHLCVNLRECSMVEFRPRMDSGRVWLMKTEHVIYSVRLKLDNWWYDDIWIYPTNYSLFGAGSYMPWVLFGKTSEFTKRTQRIVLSRITWYYFIVNQVETVSLNEIRQHFSASIAKVLQRTLNITKREYDELLVFAYASGPILQNFVSTGRGFS